MIKGLLEEEGEGEEEREQRERNIAIKNITMFFIFIAMLTWQ